MTRKQISIIIVLAAVAFLALVVVIEKAHAREIAGIGCIIENDEIVYDEICKNYDSTIVSAETSGNTKLIVTYRIERGGSILGQSERVFDAEGKGRF